MRRVRYGVAVSLDGFIAGPRGEADWIVSDPDIDFSEMFAEFDTFLIGRRTFETMGKAGQGSTPGIKTFVFSSSLRQQDYPKVTIVPPDQAAETVSALRAAPGKDIWLFGGGELFRSLAEAGLVDTVEVGVMPVLLGGGIPLFPPPAPQLTLTLTKHRLYEKTGIISLQYAIVPPSAKGRSKKRRAS
ncbi:MAG TPA: dihydrofolate reductase family protein [Vicinamibacterales bacterium]|jgi:dihydrofolate reductase|nr:dihydrofolate reductase family protein [Vicinamibacterales bacterium]